MLIENLFIELIFLNEEYIVGYFSVPAYGSLEFNFRCVFVVGHGFIPFVLSGTIRLGGVFVLGFDI